MRQLIVVPLIALAGIAAGCASKTAAPAPPSVLSGTAALSSFRSSPSSLVATDETGRASRVALASDGRFSLPLTKGHVYKLALATSTSSIPVAFPRKSGKLSASFALKTDGAAIHLGSVRYLPAAPATGFKVTAAASPSPSGAQGDCVDCVNDDPKTTCEDGSEGEAEAKSSESESSSANAETNAGTEQADPNQEMAVGDQNAPDDVTGCDKGGDEQDGDTSNVEQTGEH